MIALELTLLLAILCNAVVFMRLLDKWRQLKYDKFDADEVAVKALEKFRAQLHSQVQAEAYKARLVVAQSEARQAADIAYAQCAVNAAHNTQLANNSAAQQRHTYAKSFSDMMSSANFKGCVWCGATNRKACMCKDP